MPIYYEVGKGLSAHDFGLVLIPLMVATVAGATLSGRMMARLNHYKIGRSGARARRARRRRRRLADLQSALRGAERPARGLDLRRRRHAAGRDGLGAERRACPGFGHATATTQFFRQLGLGDRRVVRGAGAGRRPRRLYRGGAPLGRGIPSASFRLVFAALAVCLALSCLFMARLEERPLRGERRH